MGQTVSTSRQSQVWSREPSRVIFRLLVGVALAKRNNTPMPESWGVAGSPGEAGRRLNVDKIAINEAEAGIEDLVSEYIDQMPFLWLNVNDAPGPRSKRV